MDIEKMIVSLRSPSWQDLEDPDATLLDDAATALATSQAENEKLRYEVERQRRSADDRQHLYENAEWAYIKVQAELEQYHALGPIDHLRELARAALRREQDEKGGSSE